LFYEKWLDGEDKYQALGGSGKWICEPRLEHPMVKIAGFAGVVSCWWVFKLGRQTFRQHLRKREGGVAEYERLASGRIFQCNAKESDIQ